MLALRPYQSDLVADVRALFARRTRRVLVVSPTGSGKTILFGFITRSAAERGKRVVILVHRAELVRQTHEALNGLKVEHGIIAADHPATEAPVQVASVATLARRLAAGLEPPDLIVVDECHHAVAGSWRAILDAAPEAFVLGVTATPQRLDGRGLAEAFDAMVLGPSTADLQAAGHLVPARVYAPLERIDLSSVRTRLGDYEAGGLAAVMSDPAIIRAALRKYLRHGDGCPAVAFACGLEHSRQVVEEARALGIRAEHVDGKTPADERARLIAGLATGEVHLLSNAGLISEGVDVPAIGAAILLRPTQSVALALQQVGRALRPAPGKERALVLDWAGISHAHDLPDAPRSWTLDGRRRSKPGDSGFAGDRIRQCVNCGCLAPAGQPKCDPCGRVLNPTPLERCEARATADAEARRYRPNAGRPRPRGCRPRPSCSECRTQRLRHGRPRRSGSKWRRGCGGIGRLGSGIACARCKVARGNNAQRRAVGRWEIAAALEAATQAFELPLVAVAVAG